MHRYSWGVGGALLRSGSLALAQTPSCTQTAWSQKASDAFVASARPGETLCVADGTSRGSRSRRTVMEGL
jgi:hypothetical protein